MSGLPDYLDETSGRTYAILNLGCAAVVWAGGLLATLLIPGDWRQGCWTWAWGAAGGTSTASAPQTVPVGRRLRGWPAS